MNSFILAKIYIFLSLMIFLVILSGCSEDQYPASKEDKIVNTIKEIQGGLSGMQYQGEKIFLKYCSVCHGERGESDGFNTYNLPIKPAPFSEEIPRMSDEDLRRFIKYGSSGFGRSSYCPPREKTLNDKEISLLITFLRSLQKKKELNPSKD